MWMAAIPPMNAPDEPAYLQAVMETRNKRMLPEVHIDYSRNPLGDFVGEPGDRAAREYAAQHGIGGSIKLEAYQNSQPPLYFMVAGVVAMILPPDPQIILYVSRLISVVFGAGTIFFCWAAMRQIAPRQPMWAVGVAVVIALLPEFCFNNARAGNDSIVNCLAAASFYVWFRGLRDREWDRWMLWAGGVAGLALLAKLTALALVPGVAVVVLLRMFQVEGRGEGVWRERLLRGARMAVGSGGAFLAVCGWWVVRNMVVYGELTGTGEINYYYKVNLPPFEAIAPPEFAHATWTSLWGVFGWQNVLMPPDYYTQADFFTQVLVGLSVAAAVFIIVWRLARGRSAGERIVSRVGWQAALVFGVVSLALFVAFIQYNMRAAAAPQGRYFYLLLLPGAILFMGGLYALVPNRVARVVLLSVPVLWLAIANFVGLLTVVAAGG
jgi:hypothetical protein